MRLRSAGLALLVSLGAARCNPPRRTPAPVVARPAARGRDTLDAASPRGSSPEARARPVCQETFRADLGPAPAPVSLAALEAWAVLVAGETRYTLVSTRSAPEPRALQVPPLGAYAARVGGRGGVIAGDRNFTLRLDDVAPTTALPLATQVPATAASGDDSAVLAAQTAEGIVALVFAPGRAPVRALVPARGARSLSAAAGSRIALGWFEAGALHLAALDPRTGALVARAARTLGDPAALVALSIAWWGERVLVAHGERVVHTGGRAHQVHLATWTPGGDITPAGRAFPEVPARAQGRVGLLAGRPALAWIDDPAPGRSPTVRLSLLDDALGFDGEALTLTAPGARPDELVFASQGAWGWLTWSDGTARRVTAVRCGSERRGVESGMGVPPGCDGPEDCAGRRCVVSALGGPYGCTDETCCGASECANGCHDDAECPPCRPRCVRFDASANGTCRARSGP